MKTDTARISCGDDGGAGVEGWRVVSLSQGSSKKMGNNQRLGRY